LGFTYFTFPESVSNPLLVVGTYINLNDFHHQIWFGIWNEIIYNLEFQVKGRPPLSGKRADAGAQEAT
jgi:hypothetical protein